MFFMQEALRTLFLIATYLIVVLSRALEPSYHFQWQQQKHTQELYSKMIGKAIYFISNFLLLLITFTFYYSGYLHFFIYTTDQTQDLKH